MTQHLHQLGKLLRVKELKKDNAYKEMQAKREEVREAEHRLNQATQKVDESRATLPSREDRIYDDVMHKVVDLRELDRRVKAKVAELHKSHEKLEDLRERAKHVHLRLLGELDTARIHYRKTEKDVDKYGLLIGDEKRKAEEEHERREEVELEDGSARKKPRSWEMGPSPRRERSVPSKLGKNVPVPMKKNLLHDLIGKKATQDEGHTRR